MTEIEVHDLLTFILADFDAEVKPEKRRVWFTMFNHVPFKTAMIAAQILLTRKSYGLPRVEQFAEVLNELASRNAGETDWSGGWEQFVTIARCYGRQTITAAARELKKVNPTAAKAAEGMWREYYNGTSDSIPSIRSLFKARYETLANRNREARVLCPEVLKVLGDASPKKIPIL